MRRLSISDPEFTYDPEDPVPFQAGLFRLGPQVGAKDTGMSVYELPPGQALCPYHYEYGEEEWLLVLDGRATVRTPEGVEELSPFDVVFFPKGPEGAHQIRNDSVEPAWIVMWSSVVIPTATAYPDSGKVGVWTGDRPEDLLVPRAAGVGYYHGEVDGP